MAELTRKIRKSNFSPEEIEALVNTVSKHYNILYGEFAKRAINKHARHRVWLDVTKQVNRVSIERRTLQEVKNKWKKCQHLYREQEKLQIPEEFDSMPLEQRLTKISTEEPVLQSQPLSPTKLKVTRQTTKPSQPSPKPPTPEPPNEEVCLRWNSHHSNMQSTFPNLLLREQYVDATLVAEGQTLKCHRLILSSCSPYFEEVLSGISPFQHPVLFMKDIPFWILKSLCDFMYAGEVHIFQNKLEELLAVAETLKIKGLAGKQDGANEEIKSEMPVRTIKDEKKEEIREKKKQSQTAQQSDTPPAKSAKTTKSTYASRRNEKINRELIKTDDILDPLDLLEPVYEELTKESKPVNTQAKFKESKLVPVRKSLPKKVKKRKLSEDREESPPPLFLSRKGTRSRPNVKIPKYYHPTFDRASKSMESPESTIVREPHTDQADPLMQVDEIKAEPLDVEDDVIEIEDTVIEFDHEMHDEEEIIGNYDSPIVNLNDNKIETNKGAEGDSFKKISLIQQPIIMDVHSIVEKPSEPLKIVDVAQFRNKSPMEVMEDKTDDPLEDAEQKKSGDDPLHLTEDIAEKSTENIIITNIESVKDSTVTSVEEKEGDKLGFHIEEVVGGQEESKEANGDAGVEVSQKENKEDDCELGFHIAQVASEQIAANEGCKSDHKEVLTEDCSNELGFQITSVVSGHMDDSYEKQDESVEAETVVNSLPELVDESQTEKESVRGTSDEVTETSEEAMELNNEVVKESNELAETSNEAVGTSDELVGTSSETAGMSNELVEMSGEEADINDTLSDETMLIAESLEELLEK